MEGEPFVGPAGRLLDEALVAAGIDQAYVTNVAKHFKFEQRGKRRFHKKPNMAEITACRPWLDAEIEVLQPTALVCLGATAAQALLGRSFRVTQHRSWADRYLVAFRPANRQGRSPKDRRMRRPPANPRTFSSNA